MSFETDEQELREAVAEGRVDWVLSAFKYQGREELNQLRAQIDALNAQLDQIRELLALEGFGPNDDVTESVRRAIDHCKERWNDRDV